jgi:ABC-type glycerol-3-phosphate transport system substrate-binding protein
LATAWDGKELGVLPWPTWTGTDPSPAEVEGWHLGLWSGSKHLTEAGKFFRYFFSPAGQMTWAKIGGQIPAVKTVLQDPFFKDPATSYIGDMINLMSSAKAYPQVLELGGYGVTIGKLNEATARVLEGADPMAELTKVNQYFREQNP